MCGLITKIIRCEDQRATLQIIDNDLYLTRVSHFRKSLIFIKAVKSSLWICNMAFN